MYFVADESFSMTDLERSLNDGLTSLLDAMHESTNAAAKIRFSFIGFSDNATVRLPMCDLRTVHDMPRVQIRKSTSYQAVFEFLQHQIPSDISELKAAQYQVHRPAVFFLSDGQPNRDEDWQTAHRCLTDPAFGPRPNILAFGLGDAHAETIAQVATGPRFAYLAAKHTDTGRALLKFMDALTRSMINTGNALAEDRPQLQVAPPDDWIVIDIGEV